MKKLTYSEAEKIVEARPMSAHEVIKAGEPTEMAGVAEAETQAAYAWALDYDDLNEFPTQRLTSRHITALGVAVSLAAIAVAGAVMLVVPSPKPSEPSEPVAITPAAVLDGTYRFDFNPMNDTIMGLTEPALGYSSQFKPHHGLACLSIRMHPIRMHSYGDSAGRHQSPGCEGAAQHTPMAFHQWSVGRTVREVA